MDYDIFYKNVKFIAKNKGIKMSAIEEEIGRQQGYLSRQSRLLKVPKEKGGLAGEGYPSIEKLEMIANRLGVDLFDLLKRDMTEMSPDETRVYQLVQKLLRLTTSRQIVWFCRNNGREDDVDCMRIVQQKEDYFREYNDREGSAIGRLLTLRDCKQFFAFLPEANEKIVLSLFSIITEDPSAQSFINQKTDYQFILQFPNKENGIIFDSLRNQKQVISNEIQSLYAFLVSDVRVSDEVQDIITAFLNYEQQA